MLLGFILVFLFSTMPGLASSNNAGETISPSPNVLLITVDTLRADHLSCYGYHLRTSPNMDRLASEGTRFERAHTAIPLTGPGHFSLLTSRFPQEHGARINGVAMADGTKWLSLPQVLRKHGYHTAAFVSAWPLTSRLTHMDRWFDHYDEDLPRSYQLFNSSRYAEDVTPVAINWLKQNSHKPFFLWVHYFDPHSPYHLRKGFTKLEATGAAPPKLRRRNSAIEERILRYDSEIAYADSYIGKLLGTLDELSLRDSTLVVLTADHGESLGEHKYVGHGRHLYEGIVHIPLIFRLPGKIEQGSVIDSDVSLLDVTPTIVDLALKRKPNGEADGPELPVPFGGRSLASALEQGSRLVAKPVRYVTFAGKKGFFPQVLSWLWVDSHYMPLRIGRTYGPRKLVWTPKNKTLAVYNLQQDPYEISPSVFRSKNSEYERETARLGRWYSSTDIAESKAKLSKEDLEVLKSLGYTQ